MGAVALAPGAAAQDTSPAALNALEVKQLVARAEPSDHARLGAHFSALEAGCRPFTLEQLNSRPIPARLRDAAAALFAPYL